MHVLRNSLIPVVTAAGPILGFLITGSFVIEQLFSIPGIGNVEFGVGMARKGWLGPNDILNTRSVEDFTAYARRRH